MNFMKRFSMKRFSLKRFSMKRSFIAGVAAFLFINYPSYAADMTIREMLKTYDELNEEQKNRINEHVGSLGNGMLFYNEWLRYLGKNTLYCPPRNLSITNSQYFQIFRNYSETKDSFLNDKTGNKAMYLLFGLIKTFPCK